MQNSHLIVVLKTFSKKELRDLEKWLESPSHNQRQDVLSLFQYLATNDALDSEKHLKKEKIYGKIFPREPFDDAKLRQTIHFLFKAVEEFLIYQKMQEDVTQSQLTLASIYRQRKLDKAFKKSVRIVEELQTKLPYRNQQYLHSEYLLQQEKYLFLEGKERTIKMNLQEVSDALDASFIADKLRQSCNMLAHQMLYKASYNMGLLEAVLHYIEDNQLTDNPAIGFYYYIYKTLTEEDNATHFEALNEQIQVASHLFPQEEMRGIYLHAINYCIVRLNSGQEAYFRKAFELYKKGIEEKILLTNNTIDPYLFRNVTAVGLKLKEFTWVDFFIHNYKDYLVEEHRENFFKFNLARLRVEQNNYDSAIQLLAATDFDDVLIHLSAKTMLLKIYYELEEIDALESLLESMRTYLNRKELVGSYRPIYQNIIRYTKKLVRLNPYDKARKEKLRQEILNVNPLPERPWLLKQLDKI
ncbi:MAG: hypothetical protein ACK4TA_07150 [Saprospiraceae bacterium]